MRRFVRSIMAVWGLGATLGGASASAQSLLPDAPSRAPPALGVPYLPQSELLCGGAAVAMVERWWGRRGVYAEDFVGLVRPAERGIRTTDLAAATSARGWETVAFDGTPAEVQRIIGEGVPVVVLIRIAPNRYHYVVLLRWSERRVIFHDPARGPSRSLDEARFLSAWSGAERWAMVLRPAMSGTGWSTAQRPPTTDAMASAQRPLPVDSMPCRPWLGQAVDAAASGRLDVASDRLAEAARVCPAEPLLLRELAGVRFKERRWGEAVRLSGDYVTRAPDDRLGWQLLAASRYLSGDRTGALRAWNRVGAPIVDLVRIDGLRRVRFRTIADAVAVPRGTVLTPADLALARRRVADIPALRRAAVEYQPVEGGRVEVQAAVAERPLVEPVWRLLGVGALRAITRREVAVAIATPTGGGELWTGMWRWEHAHPRVDFRVDMPARLGVIGVEGVWERFRFAVDTAPNGALEETRHAGGVGFGGWITPSLRPSAGLGLEQWSGGRKYLAVSAGTAFRAAADRFILATSVDYGQALTTHPSYARGSVGAMWTSSIGLQRASWSARLGLDLVSHGAPLGLWPVASGDLAWAIPLRAHSRASDGMLPGATTGRSMIHGGLSGDQPVYRAGPVTLTVGAFLDGAEIVHSSDGSGRDRFYVDAGGGLRIGILDGQLGVLRIDLATGLTDRRTAITVGMHQSWPPMREGARGVIP